MIIIHIRHIHIKVEKKSISLIILVSKTVYAVS